MATRTSRPPETARGRIGRWGLTAFAVAGFVYLFTPIVVIVAQNRRTSKIEFV